MNTNTSAHPHQYSISKAAAASGVSAKMIRHYEAIGLIPAPERTSGNYRAFDDSDVHTLRFIQRARALGFSMKQIATLVSLWRNRGRSSANVRRLALDHIAELRAKIESLQAMVRTLEQLAEHCHGDARPECPILDELAESPVQKRVARR
ncbi:MAG: Cu(I)-responsive transcriptional regulator [Povalibacter sp.]|jgi:MerR family copper efflux transcriptional regulator